MNDPSYLLQDQHHSADTFHVLASESVNHSSYAADDQRTAAIETELCRSSGLLAFGEAFDSGLSVCPCL